ncbi:MAG: protein phosphatase 2C domain-containing protein [Gemmatimonadales bacterium]|jgi:protein phosphatase
MASAESNPLHEDIDVYGMTHVGKVRKSNQDHFLLCSLHKQMEIHGTSLPNPEQLPLRGERLAFMAFVADGVGGHAAGEEASRIALEAVARYVTQSMQCYYTNDSHQEHQFLEELTDSVMVCHQQVTAEAESSPARHGMATTLTLAIVVWPWAYVVQVGDSRCYQLRDGELIQLTRDQTVAQELYDKGVLSTAEAMDSKWAHVLASAIGGPEATPVINRIAMQRDDVLMLCSDGLTGYVPEEQIRRRLVEMESSQQVAEALIADALEGGGGDNITVVVGRSKAPVASTV